MHRCTRCILPESFPGISFDEHGVCNHCNAADAPEDLRQQRQQLKADMEAAFEAIRANPSGEFDALIAYSGGKDSSYILWMMREVYQLRCLAVTIDNGFISDRAIENAKCITSALGVDFHLVRPATAFVKQAFRKSLTEEVHPKVALKRASSVCNTCIGMINNHMLKTALQMNIPMIVGGYISGQVPRNAAVLEYKPVERQKLRLRTVAQMVEHFGPEAKRYYGLDASWGDGADAITILNPMLTIDYDEEAIIEKITGFGWTLPPDTGANSSNCLLNDLGIAAHKKRYGFNPYVNELAELVRNGLMERSVALEKVEDIRSFEQLQEQMKQLDLDPSDL